MFVDNLFLADVPYRNSRFSAFSGATRSRRVLDQKSNVNFLSRFSSISGATRFSSATRAPQVSKVPNMHVHKLKSRSF
eukprot:g18932.t1